MRLVHISDVHVGDTPWPRLAAAAAAINALAPAAIVLSGDLTQSGATREYAEAARFLALLQAPVVATPGNHDAPVRNVAARAMRPYRRFSRLNLLMTWTSADPPIEITAINTARAIQARLDWSQGVYPRRRIEMHQAVAGWRILAAHHPPITIPGAHVRSDARRGARLWQRLGRASRTLLLCGHLHGFSVTRAPPEGRARLIVAPTLCSGRARGAGLGFVEIGLGVDAVNLRLHLLEAGRYVPALDLCFAA